MKKIMLLLSAVALLLFWADAASAEKEWIVYKKSEPLSFYSGALGKLLAPYGVPEKPPFEYDRTLTLADITVTLFPGIYQNLFIKSTDVVLITGELQTQSIIAVTGDNNIIQQKAALLWDNISFNKQAKSDDVLAFAVYNASLQIGSTNGEIVNFVGRDEQLSVGLNNVGSVVHLNNVIFSHYSTTLVALLREDRNSSIFGKNTNFVDNETNIDIGVFPMDSNMEEKEIDRRKSGEWSTKAEIELQNPYFVSNQHPFLRQKEWHLDGVFSHHYATEYLSVELRDPHFVGEEAPYLYWTQDEMDRLGYFNHEFIFRFTRTLLGGEVVEDWPKTSGIRRSDFDGKNGVEFTDLNHLIASFGKPVYEIEQGNLFDLNQDGVIGAGDLLPFAQDFAGLDRGTPVERLMQSDVLPRTTELVQVLSRYPEIITAAKADSMLGPIIQQVIGMTAVLDESASVPSEFALKQNYPNPFNAETIIPFALAEDGEVLLVIRNLAGQVVRTLVQEHLRAGAHTEKWDGKDNFGVDAGSGMYLCELTAGNNRSIKKLMILR